MNEILIKCMTKEQKKAYNHQAYLKRKDNAREYAKLYYENNKDKVKKEANKRYKIKCGLICK